MENFLLIKKRKVRKPMKPPIVLLNRRTLSKHPVRKHVARPAAVRRGLLTFSRRLTKQSSPREVSLAGAWV